MNKLIKFYLLFYKSIFFVFSLFFMQYTSANLTAWDVVTPKTSGIKFSYYEVVWCSPHAWKLSDARFSTWNNCLKWYFHNVWGIWKMTYKWENYANGNVQLNKNFPWVSRTATVWVLDFFSWINSISFEWEGIYTVRILLVDYAYNASKFEFSYKVDKTAPQIQLMSLQDNLNSPYIFVDTNLRRLDGLNAWIVKYDSNTLISNDRDKYANPVLNNYAGSIPQLNTNHQRQDLHVMYFKDLNSTHTFQLNVSYSDNYDWYLVGWTQYIAREKEFELLPEIWDTPLKTGISLWWTITLATSDLVGQPENSQRKYRLRIYDNSVWKTWWKSNYSEIIFYAVRDNTKPNMWWNGLATTSKDASYKVLKFSHSSSSNWITSYDTGALVSNPESNWAVAKFISANDSQNLYSTLYDIWVWENNSSKYAWYNAWIPIGGWTKIEIETSDTPNTYSEVFNYTNRFVNDITRPKNFSKVDNDRNNWYRKYWSKFTTTWISGDSQLCDNVWNCLNPSIDFRVVANTLDKNTTIISLSKNSTQVFANAQDLYTVDVQLKDKYQNAIVWVRTEDNIGSPDLKEVDINFDFTNWLFNNAYSVNWTWNKYWLIQDLLPTKNNYTSAWWSMSSVSTLNTTWKVYFRENIENGAMDANKWTYRFSLASKMPTAGAYEYLNNSIKLSLDSIQPQAINKNVSTVQYFSNSNAALGIFYSSFWKTDINGTDSFIYPNTDFLNNTDYFTDLNISQKSVYWNMVFNNASNVPFSTLSSRNINFEFASPVIYWASGFTLNHLIGNIWQTKIHEKLGFKLVDEVTSFDIYEQYLPAYSANPIKYTPSIFNIYSNWDTVANSVFDDSIINDGSHIASSQFVWSTSTDGNRNFKVKSSPINSSYQVAWNGFNMWYVSYITYIMDGTTIKIPSISRNISDNLSNESLRSKWSQFYLSNTDSMPFSSTPAWKWSGDYVLLWDPIISAWILSSMWIAITGLSNSEDLMIVDKDAWRKANLNVGENLTRYNLLSVFKKNVIASSAWIWNGNTKKWCSTSSWDFIINDLNSQSNLQDCTLDINGEKVTFIEWNVTIQCTWNCMLSDNSKRTIIVNNGSTYVKSNITTLNNNSQLLIGTIRDWGLQNITIDETDNPILLRDSVVYGWTFIDPLVTNIDAFIVSQGPMISYDNGQIFNAPSETQLKNQLHIYWSTLTSNTIGWYKWATSWVWDSKCPYIIENCTQKTAFIFDLVTLRRYSLEGAAPWSSLLVPTWDWLRSGKLSWAQCSIEYNSTTQKITSDSCASWVGPLRRITDLEYIVYPLFVEKDALWNESPSIMFQLEK